MHREILGLENRDGKTTDHVNHNGLDNRESNIRVCTCTENQHNRRPEKNRSSKYKGVSRVESRNNWVAYIRNNGTLMYLGHFRDEIEAAKTYDAKAIELFGEFAYINVYQSL